MSDGTGAYLTEMHPLLIFVFGIIIGALLLFIVVATYMVKQKHQRNQDLEKITQGFVAERLQTEAILNDIDLGVMAFASDGKLRIANQSVLKMLDMKEAPDTLAEFLSTFGEENGLKTQALLGAGKSTADLTIGKRVVRMQMSESGSHDAGRVATIIVTQDVTEQLEQEKQRKEFVANVSHELKTPLTIIKTYSESLLDWGLDEKSPAAVKADLQRILDDVNRMENLIKDLLLLSSLDSRGKATHMEQADLAVLVRQIVDRCQLQAEEKDISLTCYIVSAIPPVFVDRSSIDRAIMNIIQNAIKYTDKNGRIDVFLTRMWDDVVLKVRDNGQGIDPKYQKAIFERFYRIDNTGSRKYGGTGLGLSIAKELVELHHGKIAVNSVLTQGSEFSITLPTAGKVYRQVMLQLVQQPSRNPANQDTLTREARRELLAQAEELGMKAESLEDLTRAERDILMRPYRMETEPEEANEDFAGVFRQNQRPATETAKTAANAAVSAAANANREEIKVATSVSRDEIDQAANSDDASAETAEVTIEETTEATDATSETATEGKIEIANEATETTTVSADEAATIATTTAATEATTAAPIATEHHGSDKSDKSDGSDKSDKSDKPDKSNKSDEAVGASPEVPEKAGVVEAALAGNGKTMITGESDGSV